MNFNEFEQYIGIVFKDKDLLKQAFTHRSYINEHRNSKLDHNERLEFLGDAVLELVITSYLFTKYPNKPEGDLTAFRSALVNTQVLSEIGFELNFNNYLLLSKGESKDTGRARQYIMADTCEAIIGAIYLDQGYDVATKFIESYIIPKLKNVIKEGSWIDSKSLFQEKAQEHFGVTPSYETINEEGPDHDKHFTVGVFLKEEKIAEGKGKSKQEAEQVAAKNGLEKQGW